MSEGRGRRFSSTTVDASVVQLTGVPCVITGYECGRFATAGCER